MGVRHHGDRPARRRRLATVTPIALLAGGVLAAGGALAGTPAAGLTAASAAASASVSSQVAPACGDSFTPGQARCLLIRNMAAHPAAQDVRPGVIPAGTGYGPSDLQSAYNLTSASGADGAGRTVAVVDAFNDPTAARDLAAYRSAAGQPALTSGQFTVYNQAGQTSPLPAEAPAGNNNWTEEESLDVDMVSAICPLCTIDLVEANDAAVADLLTADQAAATLGAKYISNSWGFSEVSAETALDSQVFSAPGVVYVAGAAESGYTGDISYPAASPNVVAVGGTTLEKTSSNSRGWTESVWDTLGSAIAPGATGSGCSAFEPQPSWQTSISSIPPACSKRVDNDVAAAADPSFGAAVYDTSDGDTGWFEAGGTSEATPIIAAVFALAGNNGNKAADSIYTNTSDLNEVTASNNGTCTQSVLCTATGTANTYNGPTGWGTPNGIAAFKSNSSPTTVTVTNPGNQAGAVGTAARLQIGAADSASDQTLTYTATGLPAGLSINSATGLISGTPTTAGTSQVTVTATDTTSAHGSASFTWTISSAAGGGSSQSPSGAASASPSSTCASSAATANSASATPSATPSATASATPSPTPSSSASAHLTSLVSAALTCSASATPTPSASASSPAAAPAPSAVSSNLAVTG